MLVQGKRVIVWGPRWHVATPPPAAVPSTTSICAGSVWFALTAGTPHHSSFWLPDIYYVWCHEYHSAKVPKIFPSFSFVKKLRIPHSSSISILYICPYFIIIIIIITIITLTMFRFIFCSHANCQPKTTPGASELMRFPHHAHLQPYH